MEVNKTIRHSKFHIQLTLNVELIFTALIRLISTFKPFVCGFTLRLILGKPVISVHCLQTISHIIWKMAYKHIGDKFALPLKELEHGDIGIRCTHHTTPLYTSFSNFISGVRMLDGIVNDAVEAKALGLNPEHIDIYSASWGPEDDGKTVDGPGPLARRAFIYGECCS